MASGDNSLTWSFLARQKEQEHGVGIPAKREHTLPIGMQATKIQPVVTPMTVLPAAKYSFHTGATVAATSKFLTYIVKGAYTSKLTLYTMAQCMPQDNDTVLNRAMHTVH